MKILITKYFTNREDKEPKEIGLRSLNFEKEVIYPLKLKEAKKEYLGYLYDKGCDLFSIEYIDNVSKYGVR